MSKPFAVLVHLSGIGDARIVAVGDIRARPTQLLNVLVRILIAVGKQVEDALRETLPGDDLEHHVFFMILCDTLELIDAIELAVLFSILTGETISNSCSPHGSETGGITSETGYGDCSSRIIVIDSCPNTSPEYRPQSPIPI